jgi:(1->4)-alpha-D-glucan 1-alpha-D-glucosylmutase
MPLAWHRHVRGWRKLNRNKKTVCGGIEAPTANDEYLLYQTLVGAWPLGLDNKCPGEDFVQRICDFMRKAIREAKENTNWANPNQDYEVAVTRFVKSVLESKVFRDSFLTCQRKTAYFGMLNSLSQTLIKLTAPGVPDIYQGNELWEFSLVDPDNRRPVDYKARHRTLQLLKARFESSRQPAERQARELAQNMEDGLIKLYTLWKMLDLRNQRPKLFNEGEYIPLRVTGDKAKHVLAFARKSADEVLITAVPRPCAELLGGKLNMLGNREIWGDTRIELLPTLETRFENLFTGELFESESHSNTETVLLTRLFDNFPGALLISAFIAKRL